MIARLLLVDLALFHRIASFRPAWAIRTMKAPTHLGDAPSRIAIGA